MPLGSAVLSGDWHGRCTSRVQDARLPRAARERDRWGPGPVASAESRSRRGEAMNEDTFQRKLAELIAEIGTLPSGERDKIEMLAEQTRERHRQLKETVSSLQESIDFVRLSIKYMLFDLEATRRENAQLRKMLDENSSSP